MIEKHRLASFCATGNQEKFLSDETGNRRWLCFLVSQIDDPRSWGIDYGQLYAQLRDEYHADFHHWFSPEQRQRIQAYEKEQRRKALEPVQSSLDFDASSDDDTPF